jgi:integrase
MFYSLIRRGDTSASSGRLRSFSTMRTGIFASLSWPGVMRPVQPLSRAKTTKPFARITMLAEHGRPCIGPPLALIPLPLPPAERPSHALQFQAAARKLVCTPAPRVPAEPAAFLLFGRLHGRHTSEACRLKPEDIDADTWHVTVRDIKTRQQITFRLADPVIISQAIPMAAGAIRLRLL